MVKMLVLFFFDLVVRFLESPTHLVAGLALQLADEFPVEVVLGLGVHDALTRDEFGGRRLPSLERHLHCGIYRARAEVKAIVHAHPKWSTFLTMTGHKYEPVYAQGSLVYPVPLLDTPNSINNRPIADRLAATLGSRPAALMKSHGAVTVGKDIVEAFVLANYMEENAYRQYMALQIGKPYVFTEEEIALSREKLWNDALFRRTWDHFRAKLEPLPMGEADARQPAG